MAHTDDVPTDSRYMDYAEHERTYRLFIGFAKWGTIAVVLVLLLLAFLTL